VKSGTTKRRKKGSVLEALVVHGVLVAAVIYALYPVLWVITLALSPSGNVESRVIPLPHGTEDITLDNFRLVTGASGEPGSAWLFARQVANSLIVSFATAATAVAIATPAAYALARFEFVGKRSGLRGMLLTQMFPGVASAVPLYLILDALKLLDTRSGLVLVYAATAVPFAVFQLRGAFLAIPIDLEEAAMVDGATRTQAFLKVALPAARPAIAVTALFAFMSAWNEFILAATLLGRESAFTLPVVLQKYVTEHSTQWGAFAAGAVLVSVPVMLLFYVAQRQLLSGLTAGGVKG
jgi:arabinogalactan oligomer/maltooligosaccharide transport system permease protein